MRFFIADSFPKTLARLPPQEQKAVKTTVFDLQMDPGYPGFQFHSIENSKDQHFWSVRVSRDIGLIVHKTEESFLNCFEDHHDAAYVWAERRQIETHPARLAIGRMHLAKGLEYKANAVMACDDDVLPLQERVETVADPSELDDVYETERHLFYVACTRARDRLLITGNDPGSAFLGDLALRALQKSGVP